MAIFVMLKKQTYNLNYSTLSSQLLVLENLVKTQSFVYDVMETFSPTLSTIKKKFLPSGLTSNELHCN